MRYTQAVKSRAKASRVRAPRQQGPRTTLRLPGDLAELAERDARARGLSRNDVLIQFVRLGAEQSARMSAIEARAQKRFAAWRSKSRPRKSTDFPTAEAWATAVARWRAPKLEKKQ